MRSYARLVGIVDTRTSMASAQRLYERLGFIRISEHGLYWLMEWSPPGAAGTA